MRLLLFPMSWGRGIGPMREAEAIMSGALSRGWDVAVATKPAFLHSMGSRDEVSAFPLPERERRPVSRGFYEDFAAFQGLADPSFIDATIAAQDAAIEHFAPEVALSILQLTASVSTAPKGIALVSSARFTEDPTFGPPAVSAATPVVNERLAARGQPRVSDVWDLSFMRSDAGYVVGVPALEPALVQREALRFVGLLEPAPKDAFDWGSVARPWVYCYLSDKGIDRDSVIAALASLSREFECSVSVAGDRDEVLSEGVRLCRGTKARAALYSADVVLTPGTRTTVLEALDAGAGLAFLISDDDELAFLRSRCLELGCASQCEPTSESIARAVREAADAQTRAATQEISDQLRALPGVAGILSLLEDVAAR